MKTKSFIASMCLLFALLPLLSAAAMPPDEIGFAPAQRGFVTAGEKTLQYAPARILVKFKEASLQSSRLMIGLKKGTEVPSATTGIATVDALGIELGVARISRPYVELKNKSEAARLGVERWYMLELKDGSNVMDAVARYAADPGVESAQPDYLAFPAVIPTDPLYHDSWGHNNTAQLPGLDWGGTYDHTLTTTVGTPGFDANAEVAWGAAQGFGSASVIIAIIDTGADIDHPDLTLVTGYDFGDSDTNPDDNSSGGGHGTCCSGVAVAKANNGLGACGIAPGCKVMPLKVANSAGSMYFSAIQNALYYAADNGANIISMSLGAAISSDPATDTAILYAYNAGCVILAATGNENMSTISYPAINANVIGVGAASPCGDRKRSSSLSSECNPGVSTDPNGYTCDGERWWGSNYGTNTANAAGAVDVIGPTILPTTDIVGSGGYRTGDYEPFFNGTSCATPYVAGVCALIKSANPTWTNAQIRTQLVNTAIDVVNVEAGAGWDRYTGYGMVDAAAAVGGGGPVAPVAAFIGSPTSGTVPLTVNFTDQSSGAPTSWSWTFGDGGTSTAQNPIYTYNATGTYTVTLTATNAVGSDGETKTNYITVNACAAPVANFVGTPTSGSIPLTVNFTDQSTNSPTSWSWTFGDGGTSTAQNPSHVYSTAGTYSVTLTATNGCGSDAETKTNYITASSSPTWTRITFDNFETGMGTYTDGGADMARYRGTTYSHQGSYSADIQDNSGTASSFYHTTGKNVSSYNTLQVDFWFYAVSMESGEDFWVQYYNGSSWSTVATYTRGTNFSNGAFYHAVVTIPRSSYTFPTNAKIRFMCDASDNNDDVYIDEIEFRGTTSVVGAIADGLVAQNGPVAPSPFSLSQNYPNPFNPITTISFN
ncbi:MAG: S8 family serine peptidase, partial [Candidatus Krumholzibacteria bacterium]|nr:S8 family serine peptidase [Candidatus Krumholzibacteria bacterium]